MKRAARLVSIGVLSVALLTTIQACGFNSAQAPKTLNNPPPDAPRQVTDLSQLAPGNALEPFGQKEQTLARRVASDHHTASANVDLDALGGVRHVGDDKHPCEERVLNKKAAQFDLISAHLMDQVYDEMRRLQEEEEISRLKLPTDLRWVIITGTLNQQGVLKELVIEQHSGTAAMDKLMVAACKKGLYLHNAPEEAADASGNYRVRIEARMENFASLDGEHWEFKTYLGLAIL